jgi:hypothetical protein
VRPGPVLRVLREAAEASGGSLRESATGIRKEIAFAAFAGCCMTD